MGFPLGDYIDRHAGVRHDLAQSGMGGAIALPRPTPREVRDASEARLRGRLAELVGVSAHRLFLTHGASEANALAILFLARRERGRPATCRIVRPEYPPLFDVARWAGFRLVRPERPSTLAIVSRPRNPTGELGAEDEMHALARGTRAILVDETFREFSPERSVQRWAIARLWSSGSFTKVYGADDLRVGYLVAPEAAAEAFARFYGVATDRVPPYSIAGALALLERRDRILRRVRRRVERHRRSWHRASPGVPTGGGSTVFDLGTGPDGDAFARRCLRSSVLVCPGSFFGVRRGVRVCLTRPSFPQDLAAYLEVRDRPSRARTRRITEDRSSARPDRGRTGRIGAGPR